MYRAERYERALSLTPNDAKHCKILYTEYIAYIYVYLQIYGIIDLGLPRFVIQEKADMSRMSVKFVVDAERSVCHSVDALPAKLTLTTER